ncbi:endoplasmic reticulum metallopeptidase 1, partial [Carica papaya]|uniref:endoplasmic reticulum metallopeptidase 1 n=1 Tax=Carica papaya TaxID=3649 RepID=UPI000B8CF591
MALKIGPRDVTGFKFLFSIAVMYGLMAALVYCVIHHKFIRSLGVDAPLDRFSEARAIEHVRFLSAEIGGRQEGRPGLTEAARYIKGQLEMLKERAGSNIRVDVEETLVSGSFSMMFLGYSISLGYRNHTNIIMRISSLDSQDTDPSVLLNAHFDSPLGSPGAGDCGSCVASLLELARLSVDSGWVPTRPIIFLFNGAEELFLLGAHGFMKTNRWKDSVGAFIDVEASGTGGLDLVCQSGPGSWPSHLYAQSAVYPMAHSAAQDVFPVIPGDTDYRIFSQDYGSIPGLDIIFLLGGYYYHTSYDTVDRLLPGSMQARGDNLFSVLKAFTNSSKLKIVHERGSLVANADYNKEERAVFFDYLTWFMVFYSKKVALVLHTTPLAIFLAMPFFLCLLNPGLRSWYATFWDFLKGVMLHASGIILAIVFPVAFSVFRLQFSSYSMSWFSNPYLAFMLFVPCSLVGLLLPRLVLSYFPPSKDVRTSKEPLSEEVRFWGAFGFYALFTLAYLVAGLSGGFLTFLLSAFMLPAWISFRLSVRSFGHQSLWSAIFYVMPLVPCLLYAVYFGGFLIQFFIEKMGMMGAVPPPYGYYLPDAVVAAIIGLVTGWCFGPLIPVCGHWLARASILKFFLHLCVLVLALSLQFFPYSRDAPKRVVFQHTYVTGGANQIIDSSYEFAVVDSNSLLFLSKYAPEMAKELHISSGISFQTANISQRESWLALYPASFLIRGLKFPARSDEISKRYSSFPFLFNYRPQEMSSNGSRRVYLELSLGSLEEIWVTVLNITGPLSGWSFADNRIPAPEAADGGPPSYICRLSGGSNKNW